jgi:prepilin-type N-terminal cleavage/methylation domain-containing protein
MPYHKKVALTHEIVSNFGVRRNHSGFSLVEILIAVALVGVLAYFLGTFVTSQMRSIIHVEGSSACRGKTENFLREFKNKDNKAVISTFYPTTAQPARVPADHFPLAETPYDPEHINTWQLVDSGTNDALNLYNLRPGACGAPVNGVFPKGLQIPSTDPLYPVGEKLKNEKAYINVLRYDKTSNVTDCSLLGNLKVTSDNQYSLVVRTTIEFDDAEGLTQKCVGQITLKPDLDTSPATLVQADRYFTNTNCTRNGICLTGLDGSGVRLNGHAPYFCGPSLFARVVSSEPGSYFLCNLESLGGNATPASTPDPALFIPCNSLAGNLGTVSNASGHPGPTPAGAEENLTAAEIQLGPLPEGFYRLSVKVVDSAQNFSADAPGLTTTIFGIDLNRPPAASDPAPSSPFISHFADNATTRGHRDASGDPGYNPAYFAAYYQCEQGSDPWASTAAPEPIEVSYTGVVWFFDDVLSVSGNANPSSLSNGSHWVNTRGYDGCGVGGPNNTVSW